MAAPAAPAEAMTEALREDRLLGGRLRLLQPKTGCQGRDATLVILRAWKGGRAAPRLCAPLVLHDGPRHEADGDSYRAEVQEIFRGGAALSF